jgi:hypothetical protein
LHVAGVVVLVLAGTLLSLWPQKQETDGSDRSDVAAETTVTPNDLNFFEMLKFTNDFSVWNVQSEDWSGLLSRWAVS